MGAAQPVAAADVAIEVPLAAGSRWQPFRSLLGALFQPPGAEASVVSLPWSLV